MSISETEPDRYPDSVIHLDDFREYGVGKPEDMDAEMRQQYLADLPGSNIGIGGSKALELRQEIGKEEFARLGKKAIALLSGQHRAA